MTRMRPTNVGLALALAAGLALATASSADAWGKIKFKTWPKMDDIKVIMRVIPVPGSDVDPIAEGASFLIRTDFDVIYEEAVSASAFIPSGCAWLHAYPIGQYNNFKYRKKKKPGTAEIYQFQVKKKYVKKYDRVEYHLKVKASVDASAADLVQHPEYTEEELSRIYVQVTLGDDTFIIQTNWERKGFGWKVYDKYMEVAP